MDSQKDTVTMFSLLSFIILMVKILTLLKPTQTKSNPKFIRYTFVKLFCISIFFPLASLYLLSSEYATLNHWINQLS